MDSTSDLPGNQTLDGNNLAGGVKRRSAQTRRNAAITLWLIGFIALVVVSVIVSFHPAPWPFDLQTTITLQHLQLWSWVIPPIGWPSIVGDVLPSFIYPPVWFVVLSLIGVVVWRRGGSPIPWFVAAIFITFGAGLMAGFNAKSAFWYHAHVRLLHPSMSTCRSVEFLVFPRVMLRMTSSIMVFCSI